MTYEKVWAYFQFSEKKKKTLQGWFMKNISAPLDTQNKVNPKPLNRLDNDRLTSKV